MSEPWDPEFESLFRDVLRSLPPEEPLRPDLDTAAAGLDSLGVVTLLLSVETAYDISFPDEYLQLEIFATPLSLWKAVSDLRAAAPSDPEIYS